MVDRGAGAGPASPDHAATRPRVPRRNVAAGAIALVGVVLVAGGTVLPIVEIDVAGVSASTNGWGGDLNDGPIHLVVCVVPVVMAVLALLGRARVLVKTLLIASALIGFFWVAARLADVSGSLEQGTAGALVAEVTDPGIGLVVMTVGWVLVLVAGLVATAARPPKVLAPPRVYPPVPRPEGRSRPA